MRALRRAHYPISSADDNGSASTLSGGRKPVNDKRTGNPDAQEPFQLLHPLTDRSSGSDDIIIENSERAAVRQNPARYPPMRSNGYGRLPPGEFARKEGVCGSFLLNVVNVSCSARRGDRAHYTY